MRYCVVLENKPHKKTSHWPFRSVKFVFVFLFVLPECLYLCSAMMKILLAILIVGALASEETVGPTPHAPGTGPDAPLIARLRSNSPCAGEFVGCKSDGRQCF
jgi:hypothetical protein